MGAELSIDGLVIEALTVIRDDRGAVMHMLRADSPLFSQFGEVYFSIVKRGAIKAWKLHRMMTQYFAVPVGEIRLVIYDDRESSPTRGNLREIVTGAKRYQLVRVPPMLWYGFQGLAPGESLLANCASIPHHPEESERRDPADGAIPFVWRSTELP